MNELEQIQAFHDAGCKAHKAATDLAAKAGTAEFTGEQQTELDRIIADATRNFTLADNAKKQYDQAQAFKHTVEYPTLGKGVDPELVKMNEQLRAMADTKMGQVKIASREKGTVVVPSRVKAPFVNIPLTSGGYAGRGPDMYNQIIREPMNEVYINSRATHIQTNALEVHIPTFAGSFTPVKRATDGTAFTVHTPGASDFGRIKLTPHQFGFVFQIERKLIRTSDFNIAGLLVQKASEDMATFEENLMLTGTGVDEPLGLLNAGTVIPAGQIITTGTTDVILPDELRALPYRLTKNNRKANAAWLMHRYTVGYIMRLRDMSGGGAFGATATGNFLWSPGMQAGQPIRLDGWDVMESENMPDPGTAFTSLGAGECLALFGDFSQYFIADFDQLVIEMSEEKYWLENCVAYKLYRDMDGALGRLSAIAKLNNA